MLRLSKSAYGRTKRGNEYHRRATKLADGMSRNLADQAPKPFRKVPNTLVVCGTTDKLCSLLRQWQKWHVVSHPEDSTYTKRVLRLTDHGRAKLAKLRKRATACKCQYGGEIYRLCNGRKAPAVKRVCFWRLKAQRLVRLALAERVTERATL